MQSRLVVWRFGVREVFQWRLKRGFGSKMGEAEHYERVPNTYHSAWFYAKDSPYERWQIEVVTKALEGVASREKGIFVDIGGGTGRFTDLVRKELQLEQPALCVDFSKDMLAQAGAIEGVKPVLADAVKFAESVQPSMHHIYLLKEVVHHVRDEDLGIFFSGLSRGLAQGGTCLIVTRPHSDIDYPFMKKAIEVWKQNQPDASIFALQMEEVGFKDVSVTTHGFPVVIPQQQWLDMVADRFWSTFSESHFTQQELNDGIEEIRATYPCDEEGNLHFEERIVLVSGRKQ